MRKRLLYGAELGLLLMVCLASTASAAELSGRAVMEKVLSRSGWKDMSGRVDLIMTDARGNRRERLLDMWSRKNEHGETSMLMRFVEPADVRGIGFLQVENENRDDDRHLYLPALRRVSRIATSGRGGNFMSSDFTYYDIGRPKLQDWQYKLVRNEKVDGNPCYVIEALPATPQVAKDTGYHRVIWWIDQQRLTSLKAEYYDNRKLLFKTLTVKKTKDIAGVPFATHMVMEDKITGHKSELIFRDLKIDTGLSPRLFTLRQLKRRL